MEITREVFEKLQQMVNRVVKSPRSDFYRTKFAKENFDPASHLLKPEDVIKIPRLTRQELASTHPIERLYCHPDEIQNLLYTSGTTNSPALFSFRRRLRYSIPGKRPLILNIAHLNILYAMAPRSASSPYFPPLIGHPTNDTITATLANAYGIDAIISTPSRIMSLAGNLSKEIRDGIEFVSLASERFTPEHAEALRSYFPKAKFNIRYSLAEASVGYLCDTLFAQKQIAYHSYPDLLVEIIDSKTGTWTEINSEGEIVITELYESPHQIIRYSTGDAGRIINTNPCSCGAPFAFEVTGRINHDIIKADGMMFRTDEIERVIKEFPEIEEDFRGVVETKRTGNDKEEIQFSLTIILKQKRGIHPYFLEQLKRNFSERFFLTPSKTLADCINEKRISSFDVFAVESFPFETKTQRLRLIER